MNVPPPISSLLVWVVAHIVEPIQRVSRWLLDRFPNPVRLGILWIGLGLARIGLIDRQRAKKTTELAWPRVATGIARMSKNAVDVAMVGVAVGTSAVNGVGFASPFWGLAFSLGGGVAGGTIALVSQRFGADAYGELGEAIRASVFLAVVTTVPLSVTFWLFPEQLISVLTSNEEALDQGATYLKVVGLGIPFAALNLVGSRALVGCDDAYTAMQVRAGGAVANIALNALFIFGFGWGVAGAAMGTVLSNVAATTAFALGLVWGRFPGVGEFPVELAAFGNYTNPAMIRDIVEIGTPVMLRNLVWTTFQFPMLAILDIFGKNTVAGWVIARRIWGVMNSPGWGFGLASSSLVGQALGQDNEREAESYGHDIIRFAVATYLVSAILVAVSAEQLVTFFADAPTNPEIPIARDLVYAACFAILFQGVSGASAGPLDASGDTRVPFVSQFIGQYGGSIPLAYLGAGGDIPSITFPVVDVTTPEVVLPTLGLWGLYLAFVSETAVPAAINYWRFRTNKWMEISEAYRPDASDSEADRPPDDGSVPADEASTPPPHKDDD
ncbi:MATE family efflux transporter [Halovenus rubra]|uniref:MATE family efflux transporter n=2 Tax=Halovenus rubra TaxID=869890 RepID=A0ABD5X6Y4_9EURY|nr:MATE family efflux transporter [Halovenus rubra]